MRAKASALGQALDGQHVAAARLPGERAAALTGWPSTSTVQVPQTWTSQERLAPVRSKLVAQHVQQQLVGLRPRARTASPLSRKARSLTPRLPAHPPQPGLPVLVDELVLVLDRGQPPGGVRRDGPQPAPSAAAIDWKRTARSSVAAVSTAQRRSLPTTSTPWLRSSTARSAAQRPGHGGALLGRGDQVGRLVVARPARRRTARRRGSAAPAAPRSRPARSRTAGGRGRPPRRPAGPGRPRCAAMVSRWMSAGLAAARRAVQVDLDDVLGLDLLQRHALALDQDGVAAGDPGAEVAQRQVVVALVGEDRGRPRRRAP